MQDLHQIVLKRLEQIDAKFTGKIDRLETRLSNQIHALDERLDSIEIVAVEQKHEPRIRRLEQHAGLSSAL